MRSNLEREIRVRSDTAARVAAAGFALANALVWFKLIENN
jgi:hypothetical protein